MTDFVGNFSTEQLLPPWVSRRARNWIFVIEVKRRNLQGYLDSHFNAGAPELAPFHYEALPEPFGLMRVTKHDDFSSSYNDVPHTQTLRRIDVNWAYPVYRYRRTPENIRYDKKVVWVEPLAFDNNSFTMFSSREIWGTEANMARISLEEHHKQGRIEIDLGLQGLKTFTPRSESKLLGCFHVHLDPRKTSTLDVELLNNKDLAGFVGHLFASVGLQGQKDATHTSEVNTLKQFRDVFDMTVAVYRAIVSSRTDHTNVGDIKVYEGSKVELDFMWSQTMAESLRRLFGFKQEDVDAAEWGHPHGSVEIDNKTIDWDMPRLKKDVILAASFTSDIHYDVIETLHVYGG